MMQLECTLISYKGNKIDNWVHFDKIDRRVMDTPFVNNVISRDVNFTDRIFNGDRYYGWSISKIDYERIQYLMKKLQDKLDFERMAKYP